MGSLIYKSLVIRGQGLASEYLVPTANLDPNILNNSVLVHGVFLCSLEVADFSGFGLLHFGKRSATDQNVSLEMHILDFDRDIYGQILEFEIIKFIRPIKEFSGLQELKNQILYDLKITREYVKKNY